MGVVEWMIALLAALTLAIVFLLWQVSCLNEKLERRLRIMMSRDDNRILYEIDLYGEEDEDDD